MKILLSLSILILIYSTNVVHGRFGDFLQNVKKSVHEFAEGARGALHVNLHQNDAKKVQDGAIVFRDELDTPQPNYQQGAIAFKEDKSKTKSDKIVPQVNTVVSTTPKNDDSKNSTTEKDPRQNFAGGCLPGFSRTSDGRCKEEY